MICNEEIVLILKDVCVMRLIILVHTKESNRIASKCPTNFSGNFPDFLFWFYNISVPPTDATFSTNLKSRLYRHHIKNDQMHLDESLYSQSQMNLHQTKPFFWKLPTRLWKLPTILYARRSHPINSWDLWQNFDAKDRSMEWIIIGSSSAGLQSGVMQM